MPGKREAQKKNRRDMILRASIELFISKGFEATTVEAITARAGIAKGTFFNFFSKKEDVLLYFLDKEIFKSSAEIQKKIIRCRTVAQQIELLISTYIKHIFPNKDFSKVLIRERVTKIGTGSNINEKKLMENLALLIDAAKQRGEIHSDIHSGHLAEMIFGMYTMYVIYWTNGFIKTKAECIKRIREVTQHILHGVGTQTAPPPSST